MMLCFSLGIVCGLNEKMVKAQNIDGASWDYAQIWDKFPVPARPCKKELEILEKEISDFDGKPTILILGSTIEYRSLCKKLGIFPVVADFVKSNYDDLTKYSKEKYVGEELLETDWLKIKENNKFDFILGHRIFNVIKKEEITTMFNVMYNALKPNGVFFCRGNVFDLKFRDKLEDFLDKWSFVKRDYPLFTYLEVALYMKCCDDEKYVDYPMCRKTVDGWFKDKRISQSDFEHVKLLVSMSDDARFRTVEKEELIASVGFNSVEWLTTGDEFSQQMPILKLRK